MRCTLSDGLYFAAETKSGDCRQEVLTMCRYVIIAGVNGAGKLSRPIALRFSHADP